MVEGSAAPPLFRRGPTPLAILGFYIMLSASLFVLDMRFGALEFLRQGISVVSDPLQYAAQTPMRLAVEGHAYLRALEEAEDEIERLKTDKLAIAPELNRLQHLESENAELREILALNQRETISGQAANVLRAARDPFVRRVYVDKGLKDGITAGQPVIDEKGVVGQITRAFLLSSELTLLTDKNLAVPVQIQRTGQRSVAFGLGNGQMELRYMPTSADIVVGDILHTSGLDDVYPAGFQVAEVTLVTGDSSNAFAHIIAEPLASAESRSVVMILNVKKSLPLEEEADNPDSR
ncbi:MAG: rod shape-determining protein MreC [Betaproteobacteria bacterium]|nr:rod shape-determining protein MreC [Betaproteobacteria bacterium]